MPGNIIDEVSGVFEATLNEDMADTVVRVKRPYIDCHIAAVFDKDQLDYPLVYVPAWYATYPLKKGDKVLVYFNQKCFRYPVLWKIPKEYEADFTKSITFPSDGDLVTFPSAEKVVAVTKLSEGCYVYVTDQYTLIRNTDEFYLISKDSSVQHFTTFQAMYDTFKLEVNQDFTSIVHGKTTTTLEDDISVTAEKKYTSTVKGNVEKTFKGTTKLTAEGDVTVAASNKTIEVTSSELVQKGKFTVKVNGQTVFEVS